MWLCRAELLPSESLTLTPSPLLSAPVLRLYPGGRTASRGALGIVLWAAASERRLPSLHEPCGSHASGWHGPLTRVALEPGGTEGSLFTGHFLDPSSRWTTNRANCQVDDSGCKALYVLGR